MNEVNFREALEELLRRDTRYHRDAYLFVREALDFTQRQISKANKDEVRHVTGRELLGGIRDFALQQYGPMAALLLEQWGVRTCEDFGEIVFNMVEGHLLAKTENDSREDFKGIYNFEEAFRQPFLPSQAKSQVEKKETNQP